MTLDAATTAQIKTILGDFWDANAIPRDPQEATDTGEFVAPLDSMSAVEVLVLLEEVVGQELEASDIIRQGGYDNRDQFISDVTEHVLTCLSSKEVT
ncbi:hypothetical protein DF046_12060 [Burkholderia cepacia]|uniref:hypothetical protein n=1 Tax=Burkholderia TaxID=32008 RepID=UPI000F5A8FB2|nr:MULTISPECIES: hypothetical protein [Burkholderia]RQT56333.1 hypothetical protein DF046_12060 [Burkholderia cepacia]